MPRDATGRRMNCSRCDYPSEVYDNNPEMTGGLFRDERGDQAWLCPRCWWIETISGLNGEPGIMALPPGGEIPTGPGGEVEWADPLFASEEWGGAN